MAGNILWYNYCSQQTFQPLCQHKEPKQIFPTAKESGGSAVNALPQIHKVVYTTTLLCGGIDILIIPTSVTDCSLHVETAKKNVKSLLTRFMLIGERSCLDDNESFASATPTNGTAPHNAAVDETYAQAHFDTQEIPDFFSVIENEEYSHNNLSED